MRRQQLDHRLLQSCHQSPHTEPQPSHIQQTVNHDLPRTVIGDLSAAIDFDDWNIAGAEQMLRLAGQSLGKHRRMFNLPEFIDSIRITGIGKRPHGVKDWQVFAASQSAKENHNTSVTRGWPLRSS